MLSIVMHVALILFFAWVLLHALIYSKSHGRVIEGLEGNGATATVPDATTATAPDATTATASAPPAKATQAQIDENTAEIAILKTQLINLINTSTQLNAAMIANEKGVQQNTDLIQKVVQSQNDTNAKLANMKSTK
jgi:hypothetical protein